MPTTQAHLKRAASNIQLLATVNICKEEAYYDWQITAAFYAALHIVHAYFAQYNLHYFSHSDLFDAINHNNQLSAYKLPQEQYENYSMLYTLSHRARYMSDPNNPERAMQCSDKHLAKAIRLLDRMLLFFAENYGDEFNFNTTAIHCDRLKKESLVFFVVS